MRLILLFLLLGCAHAGEAPDVTIKQSELMAMKLYNEKLWSDNAAFVAKIHRLEDELYELQGSVRSDCGVIKSAEWAITRGA